MPQQAGAWCLSRRGVQIEEPLLKTVIVLVVSPAGGSACANAELRSAQLVVSMKQHFPG